MTEQPNLKTSRHLNYLDSARGIAALMVIAYHYINWNYEERLGAKIASVVFNGSDAVSFFFVLSGFVLSYKYIVLNEPLDIKKFYVTRLFRLWPAYFITILLCALNAHKDDLSVQHLSHIFLHNKTHFWEETFLLRGHPNYYVPGWTLVIELVLSFFMPFTIALAKKDVRLIFWLLLAYLLIGNAMRDLYMFNIHFTLGVLISCIFNMVNDESFKETKWYRSRYVLLSIAVFLFSIRHINRVWPIGELYNYVAGYLGVTYFHYTGIASFVFIIAMIQSRKAKKILEHGLFRFFGKISYGIYLMHWFLVVDVFANWDKIEAMFPNKKAAFVVVFFIYAAITILLATILHYTIELPFIKIGKRFAAKMKPSFQVQ
jgi:peptidoglycan/LPS O-acetylase OafA/YrhL